MFEQLLVETLCCVPLPQTSVRWLIQSPVSVSDTVHLKCDPLPSLTQLQIQLNTQLQHFVHHLCLLLAE